MTEQKRTNKDGKVDRRTHLAATTEVKPIDGTKLEVKSIGESDPLRVFFLTPDVETTSDRLSHEEG